MVRGPAIAYLLIFDKISPLVLPLGQRLAMDDPRRSSSAHASDDVRFGSVPAAVILSRGSRLPTARPL